MKVQDILRMVDARLQDTDTAGKRWPWTSEDGAGLIDFLNQAVRNIVLQRPDATAVTEAILLESGARQQLPSPQTGASRTAISLLDIVQNMGTDGLTPGEPVFRVSRAALASFDWSVTTDVEIDNFAYDKLDNPLVFWVYPAPSAGATLFVDATYSAEPTLVVSPEDDLPIPDQFSVPLVHWVMYEVYSGDNNDSSASLAQHNMLAFYQALGVKLKADLFFPVKVMQEPQS